MVTPLRIELFGGLRATQGEHVISRFRTQRAAALLSYLAYYLDRKHPREAVCDVVWPESDPTAGRLRLRVELSSLRRQLEPPGIPHGAVLVTDRLSVQLNPAVVRTDVAEFRSALQSAERASGNVERVALLTSAVELYRGELLHGFFEEWIEVEQQRLSDAYLKALRRLTALLEQAHDFDRALDYAHRAVSVDPLREESHRTLMRLYAAVGRPAAALEQYNGLERLLKEELNVAPSAATCALAREIGEREIRRRQGTRPNLVWARSLPSPAGNLPLQFNRFFGREKEIAQLREMLSASNHPATRLVTLTGMGGSGKTRLAIEVAERLRGEFAGGVWFVSLADLSDPRLIVGTVRDRLHLSRSPHAEPLEQVVDALNRLLVVPLVVPPLGGESRDKPPEGGTTNRSVRSLLVLDNFEHLSAGGALVVLTLLKRIPSLTILVTSRRRLAVAGERVFPVLPLPVPNDMVDGQWLMVNDSTATHQPSTINHQPSTISPESLLAFPSVQLFVDRAQAANPDFQITHRNARAVAELCQCLEGIPLALELAAARSPVLTPAEMLNRLSQRFDLLTTHHAQKESRHRSLWAAVEWSYRLLSPELQRFWQRLSVFRGGWSLEAAEKVCFAEDARIQGCKDAANDASPVSLHPCLSASVVEYLSQLRAHLLIAAEDGAPEMRYRMLETLREFAAGQLTAEESADLSQRHARYFLSLSEEAEPHLMDAQQKKWLDRLETEHDNLRAALAWSLEGVEDSRLVLTSRPDGNRGRLAGTGDKMEIGLRLAGSLCRFWNIRGHHSEGRQCLAKALEKSSWVHKLHEPKVEDRLNPLNLPFPAAWAKVLEGAGVLAWQGGDYAEARRLLEDSATLYRALDNQRGVADALHFLANVACEQSDYALARTLYEQSLAIRRAIGHQEGVARSLGMLANHLVRATDYEAARAMHEESLALFRALGDQWGVAWVLNMMGDTALKQQDFSAARALYESTLSLFQELGDKRGIATSLKRQADIALAQSDSAAARELIAESLSLYRQLGFKQGICSCLIGMAHVAVAQQQWERAARLCGAEEALSTAMGIVPYTSLKSASALMDTARATLGERQFTTAATQGRAMTIDQAIELALH